MKKIISIFAVLSILVSLFAVNAAAAGADIQFSLTDAAGKPGDTVKVDVKLDKNIGTWGARLYITYDSRCFELISVTNGEIFTNSEYEASEINNDAGEYVYYAESSDFDKNNEKTGVLATLEFKILKAAPNGDYEVGIDLSVRPHSNPALTYRPGGYFFDCTTNPVTERSVEMTKAGIITVSGSDAVTLPETEPVTEPVTEKVTSPETNVNTYETEMVTEIITDDKGEAVTDEEGKVLVTEVPIAIPSVPQHTQETTGTDTERETMVVYVTDAEGEQVTDEKGAAVTTHVYVEDDGSPINTVVLVICVAAAAVAIALIVVVVITSRKNDKKDDEKKK